MEPSDRRAILTELVSLPVAEILLTGSLPFVPYQRHGGLQTRPGWVSRFRGGHRFHERPSIHA